MSRRAAAAAALLLLGLGARLAVAQSDATPPSASHALQVERGAELYAWNCAVCHGASGLGLAEARLSFPESHRRCEACHRPGNPVQMTVQEMSERHNDLFDIGVAPPLRGPEALRAFVDAQSLAAYLQAAMPRYQPGRLTPEEYLDLAAYLLDLNGRAGAAASATDEP